MTRWTRSLILPGLQGQYKWWSAEVLGAVRQAESIVQCGNLVNVDGVIKDSPQRGANAFMLQLMLYWSATDENWQQLIGPNELLALNFPDRWTNDQSNRLLRRMWFEPTQALSLKVAAVEKGRLVTHGGLTHGLWVALDRPQTAEEAAALLNERYATKLFFGSCYRTGGRISYQADPVFANSLRELYPSWLGAAEAMPFTQIHASSGVNTPAGSEALASPYSPLATAPAVKLKPYGAEITMPGGHRFINVHPEVPVKRLITTLPKPWKFYVEETPVPEAAES